MDRPICLIGYDRHYSLTLSINPSGSVGGLHVFAPLNLDKHLTSSDQENKNKVVSVTCDLNHRKACA